MHCEGIMGLGLSRDTVQTAVGVVKEPVEKLRRSTESRISIDAIVGVKEKRLAIQRALKAHKGLFGSFSMTLMHSLSLLLRLPTYSGDD